MLSQMNISRVVKNAPSVVKVAYFFIIAFFLRKVQAVIYPLGCFLLCCHWPRANRPAHCLRQSGRRALEDFSYTKNRFLVRCEHETKKYRSGCTSPGQCSPSEPIAALYSTIPVLYINIYKFMHLCKIKHLICSEGVVS
jgi:hypothetical protein